MRPRISGIQVPIIQIQKKKKKCTVSITFAHRCWTVCIIKNDCTLN